MGRALGHPATRIDMRYSSHSWCNWSCFPGSMPSTDGWCFEEGGRHAIALLAGSSPDGCHFIGYDAHDIVNGRLYVPRDAGSDGEADCAGGSGSSDSGGRKRAKKRRKVDLAVAAAGRKYTWFVWYEIMPHKVPGTTDSGGGGNGSGGGGDGGGDDSSSEGGGGGSSGSDEWSYEGWMQEGEAVKRLETFLTRKLGRAVEWESDMDD